MEAQAVFTLAIQAIGTAVMVGVFLQQHKEYGRRLQALEEDKVSREIFERAEREMEDIKRRLRDLEHPAWHGRGEHR